MSDNTLIRSISCNSFEMDYFSFGEGVRSLVIIPGLSLKSVMQSADIIAATFKIFAKDFTVYVFDRIKDMPDRYSVYDMAEDTIKAMDALGISNPCVYGTSQGGMIAMTIAARHPGIISKLAIASTSSRSGKLCTSMMTEWADLARKGEVSALNRNVFSTVYSPAYYQRYLKVFERIGNSGTEEELRRFAIQADAIKEFDIYGELDNIRCPVYLTGMEDDTVLGSEGVRDIADKLGCGLVLYPGQGHASYDEDPDYPSKLYNYFKNE